MSTCSLWTINEAAAFLRTTVEDVAAMVDRGEIPGAVRIGAGVLFRRVELRAHVGLPAASTSPTLPPPSDTCEQSAPAQTTSRPRAKNVRRRRMPIVPPSATVSDLDRAAARRALRGAGILESKP